MKLIVGLGNPGIKYEKTRHNVGFLAVDYIKNHVKYDFSEWKTNSRTNSLISDAILDDRKVVLIKPQTFMNNSGASVSAFTRMFDINHEDVIVIHDDVDIEFGKFKQQTGRGTAGHNGVQSIVEHLKTKDFSRIRIGIWPKELYKNKVDTANFVLKNFSNDELETLEEEIFPEALKNFIS